MADQLLPGEDLMGRFRVGQRVKYTRPLRGGYGITVSIGATVERVGKSRVTVLLDNKRRVSVSPWKLEAAP